MAVLACFENNARRKMLFLPQSPDLNHIKNIWSSMKTDAHEVKPTTCEGIKAAFSEVLIEFVLQRSEQCFPLCSEEQRHYKITWLHN